MSAACCTYPKFTMTSATIIAIVVSALSVIIAPVVAYLTASKRLSGRIQTSEALDLWKESAAIREDYRESLRTAEAQMAEMKEENFKMRLLVSELQNKLETVINENSHLRRENTHLRAKVKDLGGTF